MNNTPSWKYIPPLALVLTCAYLLAACAPVAGPLAAPSAAPFPTATSAMPTLAPATLTPTAAQAPARPLPQPSTEVFKGPLSVIITSPADNATVSASPVKIHGQADPGTVITLNDLVLLVDQSGTFSAQLPLESGTNLIEITASDDNNQQDFAFLTVNYEP